MAPGSGNPEYRDVMDVKTDLIDQGRDLIGEIEELKSQQAALVRSMHLDVSNSRRDITHAEDDPTWKALQEQIDAKQIVLDNLADDWVDATSTQLFKGTRDGFYTKAERAYFDQTHPEDPSEDFSVFDKKRKTEASPTTERAATDGVSDRGHRTEVVVQTHMDIVDLRKQVDQFRRDNESVSHTAQSLLEAGLSPVDLLSSDLSKQERAINAAFVTNPLLARYLIIELSNPESANHKAILATLEEMRGLLSQAYDFQRTAKEAKERVEQATIEGTLTNKVGSAVKALGKDPVALTAFIGALVGLGVLYYNSEEGTKKTVKSMLGWGAAIVGGTYLTDFLWKKMDDRHRGLFDRLGMSPGDLVAPEIVEKAKASMVAAGFPETDQQSAMDYARIFNLEVPAVNEAFNQALSNGKREVDPRVLQAAGLDAASAKRIDGASLYKALEHFYGTLCYNAAIKEPGTPTGNTLDEKLHIGLDYARSHFPRVKMSNALWILGPHQDLEALKGVTPKPSPSGVAGGVGTGPTEVRVGIEGIPDAPLAELIENNNALKGAVHALGNGDYLIEGYPYTYQFTGGKHVFVQKLNDHKRVEIDPKNNVEVQITALLAQASLDAKTKLFALTSGVAGISADDLIYNKGGYWELSKGVDRIAHGGLPNYEKDKKVPVAFQYDARHPFIQFSEVVPGSAKEYSNVSEAQKAYETLVMMPALVHRDVDHLLLGASITVQEIDDNTPGETKLTIAFSDGKTGTLLYKNSAIDTINISGAGAAELEAKWFAAAEEEVKGANMMGSPLVQAQLEKIAHDFAAKDPGLWGNFTAMLSAFKADIMHLGDSDTTTRFNQAFVVAMRQAQVKTRDYVLTNLYKSNKNVTTFNTDKLKYEQTFADAVRGLVDGAQAHAPDAASAAAMTTLGLTAVDIKLDDPKEVSELIATGKKQIDAALAPIDDVSWYTDTNQEAMYGQLKAKYEAQLDAAVRTLGASPSRAAVLQAINTVYIAAATEAGQHLGQTASGSMDLMVTNELDPTNRAEWKDATIYVKDYITKNLDWKSYGVLPTASNMLQVMDLWFKKINKGATKPTGTQAKDYAEFFLFHVGTTLGGVRSASLDSSTESVQTVSDSHFRVGFAALSNVPDFTAYLATPTSLPPAPDLGIDAYRDQARRQFQEWFTARANPGALLKLDGEWPQQFEKGIMGQFEAVLNDPSYTDAATLYQKINTFKQLTMLLRYGVFEQYITDKIEDNKQIKWADHVLLMDVMPKFVKANDVAGYQATLQTFMKNHYMKDLLFPNIGVPFY